MSSDYQWAYATWRLNLWIAGYGTYNEIDADVRRGILTPGKYPEGYEGKTTEAKVTEMAVQQ